MFLALIDIIKMLLWILSIIIIVQAVMSWLVAFNVVNHSNQFVRSIWVALDRLTEPLYRPIRKIMPDFGGIGFSPLVVLILIQILRMLLDGAQSSLTYSTV